MTTHKTATREEWLTARLQLLEAEKALTRQSDAVAEQRQSLPWVRIEKDYRFDTEAGNATLTDLFQGRSQLMIYHFMFGPDYTAGCPSCSAIADGFDHISEHLANHDVMLWAVSRAPLATLLAFRERMGWSFPWASSAQSGFNADFSVSFSEEQQQAGLIYNYRQEPAIPAQASADGPGPVAKQAGTDTGTFIRERPGVSSFALEDGVIYHCYSAYSRGVDAIWGMYQWLDRAPLGRNEAGGSWIRHRDTY